MHGKGVYTWPKGQFSKYEGTYEKSSKAGAGKLFLRDGRIYVGTFAKNKMEGEIVEISPSGRKRKGIWQEGRHVRWTDGQKKVELNVEEVDDDQDDEYETSAFSNPNQYHDLFKVR